jgi:hypothetical protein
VATEPIADLLNQVGRYLDCRAEFPAALATHRRGLGIAEASFGLNHPEVAVHLNNLGGVLRTLVDLEGARLSYRRALEIDEATYGPNHPAVAGTSTTSALCYGRGGPGRRPQQLPAGATDF